MNWVAAFFELLGMTVVLGLLILGASAAIGWLWKESEMMDKLKAAWEWFGGLNSMLRVGAVAFVLGLLIGGCTCLTWRKNVIDEPAPQFTFGWEDKPDYVKRVVSTFAKPYFGDAAKPLIQGNEDKDAFLWIPYKQVTGKDWEPHDQDGTGCCVGEGNSGAVEIGSTVEIALGDAQQEYRHISAAAVYAMARETGGMLHDGDGAVGADAAKALMAGAAVSCEEAKDTNGRDGNSKSHGSLAKKWGRSGLPKELKAIAVEHRVRTVSQVRTPEEARAALVNGYPVTVCSSVGFEGRGGFKRDADGFCWPGGTWPHCMFCGGYRADKKAFLIFQSWGPSMPPGPKTLGQPDGTFWISWDAMQRIVRSGECYAISSFDGYKSRDLDWRVMLPEAKPDRRLAARRLLEFPLSP